MNTRIQELLNLQVPLPNEISQLRANCFNAVQIYWSDEKEPKFTSAVDFVIYLDEKFKQIKNSDEQLAGDIAVVWSRSDESLTFGTIQIDALRRRDPGYPFGLIMQHALVLHESVMAFQKRDTKADGPYELVPLAQCFLPYLQLTGLEITHHRRR